MTATMRAIVRMMDDQEDLPSGQALAARQLRSVMRRSGESVFGWGGPLAREQMQMGKTKAEGRKGI